MTLRLVGIRFVFQPFSLQGLGGAGSCSQVLLSLKCEAEGVLKAKQPYTTSSLSLPQSHDHVMNLVQTNR